MGNDNTSQDLILDNTKFVYIRKEMGLTQAEACKGICNQSTLSRFEMGGGKAPSLSIMRQLTKRLGISINDLKLNDKVSKFNPIKQKLDEVERLLMNAELPKAISKLHCINGNKILSWPLKLNFYYLQALLDALTNQPMDHVWDSIIPILDDLDEHHRSIYARLAYAALGISYGRNGIKDKQSFYFGKIDEYLSGHAETDDEADIEVPGKWKRRLTLMTLLANYHYESHNEHKAMDLCHQAIQLNAHHHSTYWLPRLKLIEARSEYAAGNPNWQSLRSVGEAMSFARLNGDQSTLVQATALKKMIEKQKRSSENN